MNGYEVEFSRSARRELERLPAEVIPRIVAAIDALRLGPRPRGCRKLAGEETLYRIRVGDYRVIYEIDDPQRRVLVLRVRHRKDAYS